MISLVDFEKIGLTEGEHRACQQLGGLNYCITHSAGSRSSTARQQPISNATIMQQVPPRGQRLYTAQSTHTLKIIRSDQQPNASCSMACHPLQRNSDLQGSLDTSVQTHQTCCSATPTKLLTHTCLTALCPQLPRWAGTRKVKPIWILLKQETASGSGISCAVCKSTPCSRQKTMPAAHHSDFYRPDALHVAQPCQSSDVT